MRLFYLKNWLKWIALLVCIHFIFRCIFYHLYVAELATNEILKVFLIGSWIDLSMILLLNLPLILMQHFILESSKIRKNMLLFSLLLVNLPFLALNTLDLAYYDFIGRRSNIDLLDLISGIGSWGFGMLKIYWFLLAIFILFSFFIFWLGFLWITAGNLHKKTIGSSSWIILLTLSAFVIRGVGQRPLMPSTPLLHVSPDLQDVSGNSTLSFLYSLIKKQTHIKHKNYFTISELDKIYSIDQRFKRADFKKMNVLIIVMESFSYGFMEKGDSLYTYTPFLDSLRKESIWCDNAFGSKFESNKGLFTIMTGVPSLLDEPIYYSPYASLKFKSLGQILKGEGYSTHFFMGTEFDHFGFAKACKIAGIDHYHSKDEMGNKAENDGYWGVYDHLYFNYAGSQIKKIPQPFFATIFNVSTHHPYAIPDSFSKSSYFKGMQKDQLSIRYFDKVLSIFFQQLQSMPGYDNTLVIFVADHANPMRAKIPNESPDNLKIPLMLHMPGKRLSINVSRLVQQSDIVPSILDMLDFSKPFEAFGKSILDSSSFTLPIIWKKEDQFLVYDNRYLSFFNQNIGAVDKMYDMENDLLMHHNLVNIKPELASRSSDTIKAFLQQYTAFLLRR